MSTPQNSVHTLVERKAAAKKAAQEQQMKARVAAAWTLAKTMLPDAPNPVQLKFAKNLLANSTRILKSALRQTAINAHYTRIAEAFESEHRISLNEYLDDPSVLSKEEAGLKAELKSDPKNAAKKKADDAATAKSFEQPETYDEGKRTEPDGMDADEVVGSKPLNVPVNEKKEAAKKKAHGKDCKGCEDCDKEKKAAAAKKADDEEPGAEDAPAETTADGDAPTEAGVDGGTEGDMGAEDAPADDAVADDTEADATADDTEEAASEDAVEFDEEKEKLQDGVEDLKDDIEQIEEAIDKIVESEDTAIEVGEDVAEDDAALEDALADDAVADAEVEDAVDGEELDLASIFSDDNFEDKVASLSGETVDAADEFDDIFGPSDAAELELALDQEEGLSSAADMFDVPDGDPMSVLFGKQAAEEGVVLPGELEDFFNEAKSDDRDWATDHEDLLGDAVESVDQDDFDDPNRKQPTKLETAKEAKKQPTKSASKPVRSLRPQQPKAANTFGRMGSKDIAALLFGEDE
jgi:hypothetical protein